MENRRTLRSTTSSNKIPKPNVPNNRKVAMTAAAKRKMSEMENASQTQPAKRAAFGDLTNKKSSLSKKGGKVGDKKTLRSITSTTDSDVSSINSSQEISQSSQKSLNRQCSKDSKSDVKSMNELNTQLSGTSTSTTLSAIDTNAAAKPKHTVEPSLLYIPAPSVSHERTDLQYQDIDLENQHDPFQSPEYAQDIFNYYKSKETECLVDDYIVRQSEVTPAMRAVLVDWLVEVQENFELNHETLYLAVRLVDHYLMKRNVTKEALQLVGAAAVFIGCKFDERIPPMVDDFLYICDDAYNRHEFVRMEKDILRTVDFNLGMPISYRFLRRFAKAGKKTMVILTLARYINETCLMSYKIVKYKESLIAAGCLRLAMYMRSPDEAWDDTLVHYSGYEDSELVEIVKLLNNIMHNKNPSLLTIQNKYSHSVFFSVATYPLLATSEIYRVDSTVPSSAIRSIKV